VPFLLGEGLGGGIERVALNLVNHFDYARYNIVLVMFSKKIEISDIWPPDIKVINLLYMRRRQFLKLVLSLRRIIEREQPGFLLSFGFYANVISVFSAMFLKAKPKIILSSHCFHRQEWAYEKWLKHFFSMMMHYSYRHCDQIIAVAQKIKMALSQDFKVPPEKIKVIYNPLGIAEIDKLKQEEAAHPFFKKDRSSFVIIAVGRLAQRKRFDILLRALSLVASKVDVYLLIAGEGELLTDLQLLASNLGLKNRVDFIGVKKNPYCWIAKSDLLVLSSECEGFPMVIPEAMA